MSSIRKLLFGFARSTTCHGAAHIFTAKGRIVYRVAWITLLLGLAGGLIWQLVYKVLEYTAFNTSTELHEEFTSHVQFPALTICNLNRFFSVTSKLELATIDALMRASSPYRDRKYDQFWTHEVEMYYEEIRKRGKNKVYLSSEIKEHGWTLNDTTLQHCLFQQRACSFQNLKKVLTPMGLCYTFTPNANDNQLVQNVPGSGHGLSLHLDINQDEYSDHPDYGTSEAGIKVHLHNPDEPPQVERFGVAAPSGQAAHIVIKRTERRLMYKPWGACTIVNKTLKYHDHYSMAACMLECRLDHIIEQCGCKPYWSHNLKELVRVEECDAWKILDCAGGAEADFAANYTMETCSCNEPCYFTSFDLDVSYSTFPTTAVGVAFATRRYFNETNLQLPNGNDLEKIDPNLILLKRYRENHLKLDIFYNKLSFSKITQTKAVSEISLMSDIGGLLGLWLGISFVTLSEMFQLLCGIMKTLCCEPGKAMTHVDKYDTGSSVNEIVLPSIQQEQKLSIKSRSNTSAQVHPNKNINTG